jgi:hypothetical protein
VISRRFSAWQKVVALAPLLLLAVYLPGEMMLRCRIDGQLRPACCCPDDAQREKTGPTIEAQDCCDRLVTDSVRPVVNVVRPTDADVIASAAILPVATSALSIAPPRAPGAWAAQRYGPAREGPPLVLLKHAFLI